MPQEADFIAKITLFITPVFEAEESSEPQSVEGSTWNSKSRWTDYLGED